MKLQECCRSYLLHIHCGVTGFPWNDGIEFDIYFVCLVVDVCGCVKDCREIPVVCQ
jgi:hypothetical protein